MEKNPPSKQISTQETLRGGELRFHNPFENAPIGIGLSTLDGRIIQANKKLEQITGYSADEMSKMNTIDFYTDANERPKILEEIQTSGSVVGYITRLKRKNGTEYHADLSVNIIKIKDVDHLQTFVQDITEQHHAKTELLHKTALLEAQLNATMDGILIVNSEGKKIIQNQRTVDLWKIPRHIADNPDDTAQVKHVMNLTKDPEGFLEKVMYLYKHPSETSNDVVQLTDGTILERYSAPVLGVDGKNYGRIWTFHDITTRYRVEDELRKSEALMRTALENLPLIFYMIDNGGIFRLSIGAGLKGLGLEQNQVVGQSAFEIYKAFPEITYSLQKTLSGKTTTFESHVSGSTYFNTCVPFSTPNKSFSGLVAVALEITELKKAEEGLRKSEEKFRNLFNNAIVGMFRSKLDGSEFLEANDKYLSILGRTREETIGKPSQILWADPKERDEMVKTLKAQLRVDNLECRLLKKDGSIIHCITSLRLFPDQGILEGSITDITDRKRIEEELQMAQKLESLGVLAGGIAHDFNNLLGGIYGYVDLASEMANDEKLSRYHSKAMNTIDRARALTRQLLTFAKGGAPIQKVGHLFPFVQETAQFALSGARVSCQFDIPKDLWTCNFDENQIGQVIDNIIINAQQAMPIGGKIELAARNITLEAKEHPFLGKGNYLKIAIKDTGIGIPKELLGRIFDPFFTTKPKGHGLGLATCYSIVKRHGGAIDVESEPGKGSTFHIYLPASTEDVSSAGKKPVKKHKGSGVFLVMDDEEVMRETISDMLGSLGYTVVCKENGKDAIEFFAKEIECNRSCAGMIFDLTVPGAMGGQAAVEAIRKLNSEIPVFVASGYAEDPIMKNPAEYGFTASICKPFRKSELTEMLSKYLKSQK